MRARAGRQWEKTHKLIAERGNGTGIQEIRAEKPGRTSSSVKHQSSAEANVSISNEGSTAEARADRKEQINNHKKNT